MTPETQRRQKQALWAARIGAIVSVAIGIWFLVSGLFFWPASAAAPAMVVVGGGVYLVVACIGVYLWMAKLARRTIVSVRETSDGVQAGLRDGTVLFAGWGDPKFSVDLWSFTGGQPNSDAQYGISWKMSPTVGSARLTTEGGTALVETAKRKGLTVVAKSYGKAPKVRTTFMIRGPAAES